ncbi:MAG TPA: DUF2851 family protein [Thermomicrobiaceae bacterium]|nr:DUF2851 family protein [Thermomicrobiaceae bacterium]
MVRQPAPVSELLLAQIWNVQWFAGEPRTTEGLPLRVVYRGIWTHGLGPDFNGALIDIDGRLQRGDVEIHRRASDWDRHGHQFDPAYNQVVLHVVEEDDLGRPVRRGDGLSIPTLTLPECLAGPIAAFQPAAMQRPLGAIGFEHCAPEVAMANPEAIREIWEQAGDLRLDAKAREVAQAMALEPPHQVFYTMLLDALGYSRNREGMRAIGERLRWEQLEDRLAGRSRAERFERAAGLLLGLGGFLPLSPAEAELSGLDVDRINRIERVWIERGTAWHDLRLPPTTWKLARQRPAGHPVRRLLALAILLGRVEAGLAEDACERLRTAERRKALRDWLVKENPYLGASHAHEIVVNVVIPFALAYGEEAGQDDLTLAAGALWETLPAGSGNSLTRRTAEQICGPAPNLLRVGTARAEQGLLHIYQTGCRVMRCYECPIAQLALQDRHVSRSSESDGITAHQ